MTLHETKPGAKGQEFLPYRLRVSGFDWPGIVASISKVLAGKGVNVASLESRVQNAPLSGTPMFMLSAEVQVPSQLALSSLRKELVGRLRRGEPGLLPRGGLRRGDRSRALRQARARHRIEPRHRGGDGADAGARGGGRPRARERGRRSDADSRAEIVLAGGVAHPVSGDITTDEGGERVARAVTELVGGVDVLVNNLGQASGGDWQSASPEDWVASYQLNTLSAVRVIRAFLGGMREARWGRIIQIATIGTTRPGSRMPQYYAAKAALADLTVSLAKELLGTGITVNTVSPGLIHTPETESYLRHLGEKRGWGATWDEIEPHGVKKLTGSPIGRMAKPEEVGNLVAFVSSARAGYLTGGNVRVDGGATDTVQ